MIVLYVRVNAEYLTKRLSVTLAVAFVIIPFNGAVRMVTVYSLYG